MSLLSCFVTLAGLTLLAMLGVGLAAYALGHRRTTLFNLPPVEPPLVFHVTPETWQEPNPEMMQAIASSRPVILYMEAGIYDATHFTMATNTQFIGVPHHGFPKPA